MHWAADLIGRPWAPGEYGPERFFCWGLVHYVFATQLEIEMPHLAVGVPEEDNVAAIKKASTESGWRPAAAPAQAFDIVLMRGPHGRHVGVMVSTRNSLLLLHADGWLDERGNHGSVVAQPLRQIRSSGYGAIELWRHP